MSERVDAFVEKLRDQLNAVEARLDEVKSRVGAAQAETKASIDQKIEEAKSAVAGRKSQVEAKQAEITASLEEMKAETEEKIESWKHDREVHKLEKPCGPWTRSTKPTWPPSRPSQLDSTPKPPPAEALYRGAWG
jgi:predicted  nucleic acid-binding Zn-ribbon protein